MTKKKSIKELIAASSLGTPGAVAVRKQSGLGIFLDQFEKEALEEVRKAERDRIANSIAVLDLRDIPPGWWEAAKFLRKIIAEDIRSGKI